MCLLDMIMNVFVACHDALFGAITFDKFIKTQAKLKSLSLTWQEKELAAAAEKLAECQETIFLLGKQLKALRPQTEQIGSSPFSERSQRGEDEPSISGTNLQELDQAEIDTATSSNVQRVGAESPNFCNSPCSPSDTEANNLMKSPISSNHPKHRSTKSTSSSSSSAPTPEKHSRGFSRFFSSKGRSGH